MLDFAQKAWHLPWENQWVPHALIDINRQCNVSCRSCYNSENQESKPLQEIQGEIDTLLDLRKLDSISIVGGEPTLHKDLFRIIEYLTEKGLHSELFTNGLLINDQMAERLRKAGLDMAFLHIQIDQDRPDIDKHDPENSIKELIDEKAELLSKHGIEVGLSHTAYSDRENELMWIVDYCLNNPHVGYLLITMDTDINNMGPVVGDIFKGMALKDRSLARNIGTNGPAIEEVAEHIRCSQRFVPFCYLGSNMNRSLTRWISFMVMCSYEMGSLKDQVSLKASYLEKGYFYLERLMKGKFPFHGSADESKLKLQLFFNSLMGGRLSHNLKFLIKAINKKNIIKPKRILLQAPAYVDDSGNLVHCSNCPDAVIKKGRLVPVCIADKVVA